MNKMNKEMKSRKDGKMEITIRNQEMEEREFYGFTKTLCIEMKKSEYIIFLLKFEVLSYFD